jgi:hypothetical protein
MKNYKIINFWFGGGRGRENVLSKGYGMGSEISLETVHVNRARIASNI